MTQLRSRFGPIRTRIHFHTHPRGHKHVPRQFQSSVLSTWAFGTIQGLGFFHFPLYWDHSRQTARWLLIEATSLKGFKLVAWRRVNSRRRRMMAQSRTEDQRRRKIKRCRAASCCRFSPVNTEHQQLSSSLSQPRVSSMFWVAGAVLGVVVVVGGYVFILIP